MTAIDDTTTQAAPRLDGQGGDASHGGRIVAGVDGSPHSHYALEWALREARLRGSSVHVVMAWQQQKAYGAANVWGLGMDPSFYAEEVLTSSASSEVARLAAQSEQAKGVPTTCEAIEGDPASVLVDAAKDADLLVVGTRGHGGFVGMLLGSVSQHVMAHAECPIVAVPGPQNIDCEDSP